jgi:hypothetical protein
VNSETGNKSSLASKKVTMSHWLGYYRLLVINSFVLTILIIRKLVRGSGAVTNGSVVYNCCWASPAQSFSSLSAAGLMITFDGLRLETAPTWRTRSPYLYPTRTGWPSYTPRHWVPFRRLLRLAGLRWKYLTPPESESESYVTTDGQSASLSWNKSPIWDLRPDFYYCLMRGWVCRLQLVLALPSAVILGFESRGTRDHILLSLIRDFPFRRFLRLAGLRWRYSSRLHTCPLFISSWRTE